MSIISASAIESSLDYLIERSVRLRSSASANLTRTFSASNRKTWTWSGWAKRGSLASRQSLFGAGLISGTYYYHNFGFDANDKLNFTYYPDTTSTTVITTQVFRDPSAWYHIVVQWDTTQATAGDRVKIYVNGVRVTTFDTATYSGQNTDGIINSTAYNSGVHNIGRFPPSDTAYFDGYLTEVNFIDGQALTPSSFGQNNPITGVWEPMAYTGTYGTNGFYLNFSDPSSTTTIGYDYSGNGNNWTSNNISVTAGVTYDSMIDTPTPYADGGNGRGNYATWNPLVSSGATYSNGNLQFASTATQSWISPTIGVDSGKFYWEETVSVISGSFLHIGATQLNGATTESALIARTYYADGQKVSFNTGAITATAFGNSYTTNDIIGVAVDMSAGKIWFSKNGTWQGSGDPAAGTNEAYSGLTGVWGPFAGKAVVGNNPTVILNCGQRPFAYTPPTGFKALNTQNLPEPTIVDGGEYFNPVLYTGNATARSITGVGFQPDFVWTKSRSSAESHRLYDAVRGATKSLYSNLTNAEATEAQSLTAFDSDGFSLGTGAPNTNAVTYVAWNWKAGGTPAVTNTDGSITSTVSAGVTQGFSVVTYTGNGTSGATVGHGLGVAPAMMIVKNRNSTQFWIVQHQSLTNTNYNLYLQTTDGQQPDSQFTAKSSTTVTLSASSSVNTNGNTYVMYAFAEVPGFSKFGSYTGNGSADGPFVFCGFRPAFVMVKASSTTGSWVIIDASRNTYNVSNNALYPNLSSAETTDDPMDFLSNGFKFRTSGGDNASGSTYIFAAFAEHPFKNALAR